MEIDKRKCKKCNEFKNRILIGTFPSSSNKKYVDDNGKLWSGSKCPSCHKDECASRIKTRRTIDKSINNMNKGIVGDPIEL